MTVLAVGATLVPAPSPAASPVARVDTSSTSAGDDALYLVTLRGPGTSTTSGGLVRTLAATALLREQDAVLDAVGAPAPVYRWTTALNGFAVRLDAGQAAVMASSARVLTVERDSVRPLAGADAARPAAAVDRPVAAPRHGGAGTVIGVVDTGLAPDSPVFALRTTLAAPSSFAGTCETAVDWDAAECAGKVVSARSYVAGFGVDALRAATTVSPRDLDGHGTRTASLAAGNADVPVVVDGEQLGSFGGQAPDARLAVYKACWSAPDPADDGCSAADLVSAVDDATRDGVDVLTLAVGGPSSFDTLERALLGATEGGVLVVAAAGNRGPGSLAHPSPWVTTVGGTAGDVRRGQLLLPDGETVVGAMLSRRTVGPARVVLAEEAAADDSSVGDARVCVPGSLDAARVAGAVVVCDRGRVGRVDKSRAVALADGTAMVLVNRGPGSIDADLHSVPTLHLAAGPGRELRRRLAADPTLRVRMRPLGATDRLPRVAGFSGSGGSRTGTVKPDVLAPASSILAAVPGTAGRWEVASGTSAATAYTAGVAARLLGGGLRPAEVRSALVTTARPVRGGVVRSGAGLLRAREARRPGLALLVGPGAYRAWLDGGSPHLNTPSILMTGREVVARRRLTNVSGRRLYFSSSALGFRRDVVVTPAAVRLGRGESVTFRVRVSPSGADRLDDGYVVWRGATGTVTRIPVVLTR
ncbi:S8 family serine peptidase [Nocardioides rubriscoriae]|uniref:S8 family serine peptidase n=1 Tax=Nocardioides rubriscoriae TaxID=642762 RepID=UPI0011DFBC23|nr:S8 family serine peptidase [Nocardioides rubriscoriae]